MKWWLVLTVVAAMLVLPAASAATYEQSGYDAGRTGAIPFEGPQTNDTAFEVQLPGIPWGDAVVDDGKVYITTVDADRFSFDGDTSDLHTRALWRIDLATGQVDKLFDLPDAPGNGGDVPELIHPDVLLIEQDDELVALEIPSGEERWRTQVRPDDPEVRFRFYGAGSVLAGDTAYVEFSTKRGACAGTADTFTVCPGDREIGGVMAVDLATGEIRWDTDRTQWRSQTLTDDPERRTETPRRIDLDGFRLAVDREQVYVYTQSRLVSEGVQEADQTVAVERQHYELWALDGSDGTAQWMRNDSTPEGTQAGGRDVPVGDGTYQVCCGFPAVTSTSVTLRLDAFQALNKGDGSQIWNSPAGRTDQVEIQGSLGMGARDGAVLATSPQSVYKLDGRTGGLEWVKNNENPDQVYDVFPITIDSDSAYVAMYLDEQCFVAPGLEARDLDTGEKMWSWHHQNTVGDPCGSVSGTTAPAFGPGFAVYPTKDGTVTVVGETEASLGEPDVEAEQYPGEGGEVTIDASGAEPGAFGPADRYMVDWGDGTISGWQTSPEFSHTYNESGEYQAQVYAGNDANQTSSTFVTMNVGGSEPNLVQTAFEKDNQDMTFGILGLAVALGGGAIGVARRKRKQTTLQEELEALEEGFERTKDNPGECEAFLDTRKARAQSLLLDGDLTEEQFGVIERRIDELHRELRTSVLDTRFEFLPHGMVQSLKKMLADGRISTWEREALADLLDREETLTEAQKEKVRSQLERWFAEDAGGGGP